MGEPRGVDLHGRGGVIGGPLAMLLSVVGGTISTVNGAWRGQLVCGLIFALALVASIVARVWRRSDLRVWRDGRVCEGAVVEAYEWSRSGHSSTYTVEYQYQLGARVFQNRRRTWTLWEQKPLWVVYDPLHPERSIPVR